MLSGWPCQATLPAQDMRRARAFYEQQLELVAVEERADGSVIYAPGGTRIHLFPSRGKPAGDQTQLGFDVIGIRAVIRRLVHKGVQFDDSEYMNFKREGHLIHIAPYNAAFFYDSEGNSLGIWELASAPAGLEAAALNDCATQANLSARDIQRARRFYEERLAFAPVEEFADGGVVYEAGGTQFIVSPTTGKPSGEHPQIAFVVRNMRREIDELHRMGITTEEVEGAVLFRDSEGNVLSLTEAARSSIPAQSDFQPTRKP